MRRFAVVTTCHAAGWASYGARMVDTFLRHWPPAVPLLLYHEGFQPPPLPPQRVVARDLLAASPGLVAFKQRHADEPRAHGMRRPHVRLKLGALKLKLPLRHGPPVYRYRWDAVRFAHKTFAIFDAARRSDADVLIWIDADSVFFADVAPAELDALAPAASAVACLLRPRHTECGFVAYNLRDAATLQLLAEFEDMYVHDLLFAEREHHDSYLFDIVRRRAEARGARVHDIAGGAGMRASHVLVNSPLGRFMDHLKGDRKAAGASRADDLVVARSEAYWSR